MFKVSFKKDSKRVKVFNDKVTIVTLVGFMDYPIDMRQVTSISITKWMFNHPSIDVNWDVAEKKIRVEVSAKATCSKDDSFDAVIGERIAESRAKIKLYKFLHTLCHRLIYCYYSLIYGVPDGNGEMHTATNFGFHGGLQEVCRKYSNLWIKESWHLDKLLSEA